MIMESQTEPEPERLSTLLESEFPLPNFEKQQNESHDDRRLRIQAETDAFVWAHTEKYIVEDRLLAEVSLERYTEGYESLQDSLKMLSSLVNESSETEPASFYKLLCDKLVPEYQQLIAKAKLDRSQAPKPPERKVYEAVEAMEALKQESIHGEYYARNMREDLARSWANGEDVAKYRHLGPGEELPAGERRQVERNVRGTSIAGGLRDFETCFHVFRDLPDQLASLDADGAIEFHEVYPEVSI